MIKKIMLFSILLFNSQDEFLAGQFEDFDNLDGHRGFWIGIGLGGNYFGIAKSGKLNLALNESIFSLRYTKSDEFQFNVDGNYDEPAKKLNEFALLYGRYLKKDNFVLTFSTGICYLNGVNRGKNIMFKEFEKVNISTVGLPLEMEFLIGFSNNIGISVSFYGNLNKDKIFSGAVFKLNIGSF
jgi:hypothetical protein